MLYVHVFVYLYIKLKIVHRCNTISFTFFCFQVKNLKNVKHLKNTRNRLCHTEVLYLLVLWTTIVYSDKDNLQFLLLCYFVSYIYRERHVFIYMICENWWEDFVYSIILEWMFYVGAPLYICSTPSQNSPYGHEYKTFFILPRGFCKRHVVGFFETSALKGACILCLLSPQ